MTLRNVDIYAACDRLNYGDLLFPIIITHQLTKINYGGSINYFATVKSDLSYYGAIPTRSIKEYKKLSLKSEERLLILGGGEILGTRWPGILSFIQKNIFMYKVWNRINLKLGRSALFNNVISHWFNFPSPTPFILGKNDYKNTTIAYNAVGGYYLEGGPDFQLERAFSALSSSYTSVRDKKTYNYLTKNKVENVTLSPDCAFIISDIYPLQELEQKISLELRNILSKHTEYFCFQGAPAKLAGNEQHVKNSIKSICQKNSLKCISFSIGQAFGHVDQNTVDMLARSPELNDYVIPFCPKSIYDVMFLIAKSKCYIGTSLHGAITAAAYHRPTIGINSVKKLNEMIDCWLSPNIALYSECKDLPESFQKLLKSDAQKVFEHKITDIKQRIYKNFDDMFLPLHK